LIYAKIRFCDGFHAYSMRRFTAYFYNKSYTIQESLFTFNTSFLYIYVYVYIYHLGSRKLTREKDFEMLHPDTQIHKMSRRTALLSITSIAGFVAIGYSNGKVAEAAASAKNPATTAIPSVRPGTTLVTYRGHTSRVVSAVWSPDGQLVASNELNGAVHVWHAATGRLKFVAKTKSPGLIGLSWSANGKYIAGASSARVSVWNASNGSLISSYNAQAQGIITLAFSPDSTRIATGSFDKTVQIWKATTGAHILTYNGHNVKRGVPVVSLSWSPDGKRIVSSSSLRGGSSEQSAPSVKVWNTTTGKDTLDPKLTSTAVAWSPNGTSIASEESVAAVQTVQIWGANTGHGRSLNIKPDDVEKISWSPNSKYVALVVGSYQSISPTSRIEVRSATGGSYILTYTKQQPNFHDVAWSPDGSRIASCAEDQTVKIWQAPR
jgi:WD40 repeat protein